MHDARISFGHAGLATQQPTQGTGRAFSSQRPREISSRASCDAPRVSTARKHRGGLWPLARRRSRSSTGSTKTRLQSWPPSRRRCKQCCPCCRACAECDPTCPQIFDLEGSYLEETLLFGGSITKVRPRMSASPRRRPADVALVVPAGSGESWIPATKAQALRRGAPPAGTSCTLVCLRPPRMARAFDSVYSLIPLCDLPPTGPFVFSFFSDGTHLELLPQPCVAHRWYAGTPAIW